MSLSSWAGAGAQKHQPTLVCTEYRSVLVEPSSTVRHGANVHGQTALPGGRIKSYIPATAVTQHQKSAVAGIVFGL